MNKFFKELRERKIRKWLTIYISTAITTLGVTHLLSLRYNLPDYIFDIVFFTLLFGIAGTAIMAWFHGKEGRQKLKTSEIILQSILFIGLIVTLVINIEVNSKRPDHKNKKVIAVLPFANFSDNQDTEYFADGMTDDVLTQLSKISDLKVISRTSVMKYKNSEKNISEISDELGAGTILEGSVRKYGNKIRITGQLIDANNDVHIWSETYDREVEDVFDIQSDIAERIAAALHTKLLPLEKELIETKSTKDVEAYTFYLKGKHHYYNYTEEENEKAVESFKKALSIDSNYTLALAGLAEAYSQKVAKYWQDQAWMDSALILSKKAIAINPDIPETYKALASAYQGKEEFDLALVNYKKAIELNPNYWSAILNYGQLLTFLGKHDEAIYWTRRANDLTPNDIMGNISVSLVYKNLNCLESAIDWCRLAIELEPDHKFANYYLGELFLHQSKLDSAEFYFKKTVDIDSNWVFAWFLGGRIESVKGNDRKAIEYYDRYMKITQTAPEFYYAHSLVSLGEIDSAAVILEEEQKDYLNYFEENSTVQLDNYIALAEIFSLAGKIDSSFIWLRKAIENGYVDINRINIYPFFDNIKNDERYRSLYQTMEAKIDSFQSEAELKYQDYFECK